MIRAQITVSGSDCQEAAAYLQKSARLTAGTEVLLDYDEGQLTVEVTGTCYTIPADGYWPGICRVGKSLLQLMRRVPKGDLSLAVMDTGHLHVGNVTVECLWESGGVERILVSANPSVLELLRIAHNNSVEQIAASGLTQLIVKADAERAETIRRACDVLKRFGDAKPVIEEWVRGRIEDVSDSDV